MQIRKSFGSRIYHLLTIHGDRERVVHNLQQRRFSSIAPTVRGLHTLMECAAPSLPQANLYAV